MMKVLMITDLHGHYDKMAEFLAQEPDIVLIAGDLTDMGPCDKVTPLLDEIDVPCFAIPGNCDPKNECLEAIENSDAVSLHGSSMTLGGITITGIGGANTTPFATPFEMTEEEINKVLTFAESRAGRNVHNILLSHAPPYETLDNIADGVNVGSHALRDHLKNYDLVCCGHIHEQIGVKEIDGTIVVNPGPASEGRCAIITLGDEAKDIKVELLKL